MTIESKMMRYHLTETDLLRENGYAFVDVARLGLFHLGKACFERGIMRRTDGKNVPCKGRVAVTLRQPEKLSDVL